MRLIWGAMPLLLAGAAGASYAQGYAVGRGNWTLAAAWQGHLREIGCFTAGVEGCIP